MNRVLENVIHLVGSVDLLLEMLPPDLVARAHKVPSFESIKGNELANVLSYVHMSDVQSVLRVCKDWYNVRKNKVFWNRKILAALIKYSIRNPTLDRQTLLHYDSFLSPKEGEILRDQVEWLFRQTLFSASVHDAKMVTLVIFRTTHRGEIILQFLNCGGELRSVKWKENEDYGKLVHIAYSNRKNVRKLLQDDHNSKNGTGLWIKDGNTFEGELLDTGNRTWYPHGSGKWTLSDGTIIEGECVAYKGEVRYLRPLKKNRTNK